MFRPKSLNQRLIYHLLIPVVVLLLCMGFFGFNLATKFMLAQWNQNAILWTQRSAHAVDMRLLEAKQWMKLFHATAGQPGYEILQDWIIREAESREGIERVSLELEDKPEGPKAMQMPPAPPGGHMMHMGGGMAGPGPRGHMMQFRRARISKITLPRYDDLIKHKTISLSSYLLNEAGEQVGTFEITVRFDYLLGILQKAAWWQHYQAYLVDTSGAILADNQPSDRQHLGDNGNLVEQETLKALQQKPYGTLMGKGHPPDQVSAFYRLAEAPWSLVIIAPGDEVLAPIVRFRQLYIAIALAFILIVVLLIRKVTGSTVRKIETVSTAARQVSEGHFDVAIPVRGDDEVAQLGRSFNSMLQQLQDRMRLKQALNLAMEVQQSLLPKTAPEVAGLDVAGKSIYCDQTGGDYYDFLQFAELGEGRIVVAVGDVVGHGISAALLMTTARAFLRSRVIQPGRLADIITDVNRLLCLDTEETGNFMTLFVLMVDTQKRALQWVRAGHDPAVIYNPAQAAFAELKGIGVALGFDETLAFQEYAYHDWHKGQIILIGTDGIWETENSQHQQFGKDRLNEIIARHAHLSAAEILQAVTDALVAYRGDMPQADDVTLVVIKVKDE